VKVLSFLLLLIVGTSLCKVQSHPGGQPSLWSCNYISANLNNHYISMTKIQSAKDTTQWRCKSIRVSTNFLKLFYSFLIFSLLEVHIMTTKLGPKCLEKKFKKKQKAKFLYPHLLLSWSGGMYDAH